MSHVDEGLIHAWIDGAFGPGDPEGAAIEAHFDACADCRARAEAALRLKDRAAYVLRQMAPDAVRVEPFERILERRRASRAAQERTVASLDLTDADSTDGAGGAGAIRSVVGEESVKIGAATAQRRIRRFPLAWAATILMAVTAGWFANTMLRPGSVQVPAEPMSEAANVAVPDSGPADARRGSDDETRAEARDATADVGRAASSEQIESAGRQAAQSGQIQARFPVALKAVDSVTRDSILERRADVILAEARRMAPEASLLDLDEAGEWTAVTLADATGRLGRVPFAIAGIAIDEIQLRDMNGRAIVRVRQRVAEDAVVEIIQESVAVALNEAVVTGLRFDSGRVAQDERERRALNRAQAVADSLPPSLASVAATGLAVDDTPAVTVPQIGFTVILRGPLPADSLRALAIRVR